MHAEFRENGYVIHRQLVDLRTALAWADLYASLADPDRTPEFNPVAINAAQLQPLLTLIAHHPSIVAKVREIWGDFTIYNQRFVVKDRHSRGPVFWHQDTGYHQGWPDKCSVFVALGQVEPERGGLIIAQGSHHYGFMGDAGELNIDLLPVHEHPRVDIRMIVGDVLMMHSACWHASHPHTMGADRVLSDIIYQPEDDEVPAFLKNPFIRSRVDRIKELEKK